MWLSHHRNHITQHSTSTNARTDIGVTVSTSCYAKSQVMTSHWSLSDIHSLFRDIHGRLQCWNHPNPYERGCMSLRMLARNRKCYQIAKSRHDNKRCDTGGLVLWRLVTIFLWHDSFFWSWRTKTHDRDAQQWRPNGPSLPTHRFLCNTKGPKMISFLMIPVLCHATRYSWGYGHLIFFNRKIVKLKVCMPNHYCRCWSSPIFC
jgi:hypothetical protein